MSESDSSQPKLRLRIPGFGAVVGTPQIPPEAFHLKRVACRLVPEDPGEPMEIRMLLNDFCSKGAAFFAPGRIELGSHVTIELVDPVKIEVHGRIVWLQEVEQRLRVFSPQPYPYRCGMEFCQLEGKQLEQLQKLCALLSTAFPGKRESA